MSIPELFFRARQYLQKIVEKYTATHKNGKGRIRCYPKKILNDAEINDHYPDQVKIFGEHLKYTGNINWHYDMYSSNEFPRIFSKDIQIQSEKYGSAKHVWEVNRLLFLPWICMNFSRTRDPLYLSQFTSIIQNWKRENPYLVGINWYSNIEVNIRLINWFFCWEILNAPELMTTSPEFASFVENDWMPVIHLHCEHSYRNPSRFSSANNHLISEYAGLFIASSVWKFEEAGKWNAHAKKGLEKEMVNQHSDQGVNREEAAEYIQFITDFLLIAFVVGERTNNGFSASYRNRLKMIFDYIHQFTDREVNFPRYGDEDDGRVVILEADHDNNFKSLLTSASVIYHDPKYKFKAAGYDIKNQLLFGNPGRNIFDGLELKDPELNSCFFENEGHFILRDQVEKNEIYIHFNAAPLGYLSIAAHGHADALSFILHINGKEVLVDPGTYTYHTDPEFRKYFVGTLAHNTIRINHQDQAVLGGPTMWLKHYSIDLIHASALDKTDRITASHTGYHDLGVVHIRDFRFEKDTCEIIITDTLKLEKRKDLFVEFPLHLHPSLHLQYDGGCYTVHDEKNNPLLIIYSDPAFQSTVERAKDAPVLGWYSKAFYHIEPTEVLYQTAKVTNTSSFETRIKIYTES
jgi:hypothetical protein